MALMDVTDESFKTLYKEHDLVVLDFWAVWCGPCHAFSPVFEAASKAFPDVPFGKVETEANLKLSQYFAIRAVPTLIIIREELEVYRGSSMSEQDLVTLVKDIQSADMDEVRKKLDAED